MSQGVSSLTVQSLPCQSVARCQSFGHLGNGKHNNKEEDPTGPRCRDMRRVAPTGTPVTAGAEVRDLCGALPRVRTQSQVRRRRSQRENQAARLGIFDRTGRPRTHAGARGIVLGSFILSIFAGVLSLAGQLLHEDVEVIHALPEWSIKRRHVPGHLFSQSAVFRRLTSTWAVLCDTNTVSGPKRTGRSARSMRMSVSGFSKCHP
jgi:hypothetical protein